MYTFGLPKAGSARAIGRKEHTATKEVRKAKRGRSRREEERLRGRLRWPALQGGQQVKDPGVESRPVVGHRAMRAQEISPALCGRSRYRLCQPLRQVQGDRDHDGDPRGDQAEREGLGEELRESNFTVDQALDKGR